MNILRKIENVKPQIEGGQKKKISSYLQNTTQKTED
jgi:hypothetical protein